jgi:hypothetical protein
LENVSKPPRVVNDSSSLDYIQQYLDGSIKINFSDLNISNRIQRLLPIDERRNSFAGSSTTEGLHKRDKEIEDLIFPPPNHSNFKLQGISTNSQVSSAFYSIKTDSISPNFPSSDKLNHMNCSVLTKTEKQEDLLMTLISKIESPELKEKYLKKLKKTMIKDVNKPSKSKISLDETLEEFSKQKSKVVTVSDLQHEISIIKKYIVDLKKDLHNLKIDNKNLKQEFFKIKDCFQKQDHNSDNDDNKSDHSYEEESNNTLNSNDDKIISLINKVILPKWYAKVHIVVAQDYAFDVIALIDSDTDLNCIQEGLIIRLSV